jgi:plastocyanin
MRSLLFAALLDVAFSQQVHIIDVSNRANAPTFSPGNINIPLGDVVQFQFQGGNHSAKQSAFDTPCQAVPGGFDSGFQPFKGAV